MANVKINDLAAAGAVGDTMQLETDIGGATANKITIAQIKTAFNGVYVRKDGTEALTADWDAGSFKITAEQLESDIAIGTAPFIVTSTTVVTNLNADTVDGYNLDQAVLTTSSPTFVGLTASGLTVVNGIVQTDGSGVFSTSVTLADGTLATTQLPLDNSTKLATTAYVDTAVTVENLWDRTVTTLSPYNAGDDVSIGTGGLKDNDATTAIPFADGANTSLNTSINSVIGGINEAATATGTQANILGTPTYTDMQDFIDLSQSAGIWSGGAITDGGSGTINVAAFTGLIKTSNSDIGADVFFDHAGTTGLTLTDNNTNWIYVDYNSGTPIIAANTSLSAINLNTQIVMGKVYRVGTTVYILNTGQYLASYQARDCLKQFEVYGFQRASGEIAGETGVRYLTVTAGVDYCAHNRITTPAINTSVADTYSVWNSAASTTADATGVTQIDNLNYWNGSIVTAMTTGRYGTRFFYRADDGSIHMQYGTSNATSIANALDEPVPITPTFLRDFSIYIGRAVIQKNATNVSEFTSPFTTSEQGAIITNHHDLSGLADGDDHPMYAFLAGRSGGQTLIGGTTSSDNLTLQSTSDSTKGYIIAADDVEMLNSINDTSPSRTYFDKNRAGAIVQFGDNVGEIVFRGYDGANYIRCASIVATISGTPGTNDMPGGLGVYTTADGASTGTLRVKIDDTGLFNFYTHNLQSSYVPITGNDLTNKTYVDAQVGGKDEFKELIDVSGAYTTAYAMYAVNGSKDGLQESTTLLTEPASNQFKIARGTSELLITASSTIDQNLQTSASPTFNGLTLSSLNVANGIVQSDGSGVLSASVLLPDGTGVAGTGSFSWNIGTTLQRPGTPANGMVRYNSDLTKNEFYENGAWHTYLTTAGDDLWDRVTGTPNYLEPVTNGDSINCTTGAFIHKTGSASNLEIINYDSSRIDFSGNVSGTQSTLCYIDGSVSGSDYTTKHVHAVKEVLFQNNNAGSSMSLYQKGTDANFHRFLTSDGNDDTLKITADLASANCIPIVSRKSRAVGAMTIVQNGDSLLEIIAEGADGTNYIEGAKIVASVSGTPGTNDMPGKLDFLVTPDGSATPSSQFWVLGTGANANLVTSTNITVTDTLTSVNANITDTLGTVTVNTTGTHTYIGTSKIAHSSTGSDDFVIENETTSGSDIYITNKDQGKSIIISARDDGGVIEELVKIDGSLTTTYLSSVYDGTAAGHEIYFRRKFGTQPVSQGYGLGGMRFTGWDGANYIESAIIVCWATSTFSVGNTPTRLDFYTTPTSSSTPVLRCYIDQNGDFQLHDNHIYTEAVPTNIYDLCNKSYVDSHVTTQLALQDTLIELADTSSSYTTSYALWRSNSTPDGFEETITTLEEPAANQFKISNGTTSFIVSADCTINQDVGTTSTPTFSATTITNNLTITSGKIINNGLTTDESSESVDDDAYIDIAQGKTGFGFVQAGNNEEWAYFAFTVGGDVTLIFNSSNVIATDTDANLCIFDNGTNVRIRNRLGASKIVRYEVKYS